MPGILANESLDEVAITTNTEEWNLLADVNSPNAENISDSEPEREPDDEDDTVSESLVEGEPDSEPHNSSLAAKAVVKIQGTVNTQSRCFICGSKTGRKAIPWSAIQQVWVDKKCCLSKSNRTCLEHLTACKKFSEEALQMIEATKQEIDVTSVEFTQWLREVSDIPKSTPYNFENDGIPAELYHMFFGITKENFDDLVQYLPGKLLSLTILFIHHNVFES